VRSPPGQRNVKFGERNRRRAWRSATGYAPSRHSTRAGYQVQLYASGAAFLESLRRRLRYGCVVLDQVMPGMSGLTVQTTMMRGCAEVPIIMVSSDDSRILRYRALERGAHAWLTKPIGGWALLAAIRKAAGDPQ
jgi:DNA-binding response OmpR family regulator